MRVLLWSTLQDGGDELTVRVLNCACIFMVGCSLALKRELRKTEVSNHLGLVAFYIGLVFKWLKDMGQLVYSKKNPNNGRYFWVWRFRWCTQFSPNSVLLKVNNKNKFLSETYFRSGGPLKYAIDVRNFPYDAKFGVDSKSALKFAWLERNRFLS